jgi:hypothetical protein
LFIYIHILFLHSVLRLLVTANVVNSSPILVTLTMEEIRSSESSVFTRATRRNIPEDGVLRSNRREDLQSYICLGLLSGLFPSIFLTDILYALIPHVLYALPLPSCLTQSL